MSKPAIPSLNTSDTLYPATRLFAINESSGTSLADLMGGSSASAFGTITYGSDATWGKYVQFDPATSGYAQVTFTGFPKNNCAVLLISETVTENNVFHCTFGNSDYSDYANGIRGYAGGE